MGSYRFTTSSTSATSTTSRASDAHTRLEILDLHNLPPLRRRVRGEDELEDLHPFDLGVQRTATVTQAGDEVDNLERVGVRRLGACLLHHDGIFAACLEMESATIAPEARLFPGHRESLGRTGGLIGPPRVDGSDGSVGELDQHM